MKQILLTLLYWNYIQLSASLPFEDKPGFTPWKRALVPLSPLEYSGLKDGTQLGIFEKSRFGIPGPTCRNKLPGEGCWEMDQFTVAVSGQKHRSLSAVLTSTENDRCPIG
jgi:hypothetical protein